MQLSMGLTAWKEYGPDRWSLRVNPSSGNLHPTEAYVFCLRIEGIRNGLYHYVSRDHSLEQRCSIAGANGKESGLWIALSSINWREAWKYGERAFRYCQLDVGHAIGALRYGAAALGWKLRAVHPYPHASLMRLLGLHRGEDFCGVEKEDAEVLLEVAVSGPSQQGPPVVVDPDHETWTGKANVIDPHPMYRWPVIDRVAAATQQAAADVMEIDDEVKQHLPLSACTIGAETSAEPAVDVILRRRSAQRFDRGFTMTRRIFHRLMGSLLVGATAPWEVWDHLPRLHPVLSFTASKV
jgi:SagB-type dehydrogenase family enzyme